MRRGVHSHRSGKTKQNPIPIKEGPQGQSRTGVDNNLAGLFERILPVWICSLLLWFQFFVT